MVEFFPQEIAKVERLDTLKIGACFSIDPVGDDNFEIFIVIGFKPNTILVSEYEIPVVSLKTGDLCTFPRELVVYPLDLQVNYSQQWQYQ